MIHSEIYMLTKLNNFATNTEKTSCVMQIEPLLYGFKEE